MGLFDTTWSLQVEKLLPPVLRDCQFIVVDDDFKSGTPDNNYIEYVVLSAPGHWKESPLLGVGVYKYLQGNPSPQEVQREIQVHLKKAGFTKPSIDVRNFPTIVINSVTIDLNAVQ